MVTAKTLTAREAAWKTLNTSDIAHHDTTEILNEYLDRTDRGGQATDIVMGVVRLRGTIDRIIRKCASLDMARVKESHWNLLRMGVYELVYCPKTAEYAILNETAELAGKKGSKKAVGFINAVLRNIQRSIELRQVPLKGNNLQKTIPQDNNNGCLFKADVVADFEQQPGQYLSQAYSMPQVLVHTWVTAYGIEKSRQICIASNRHPSVILQPNIIKKGVKKAAKMGSIDSQSIVNRGSIDSREGVDRGSIEGHLQAELKTAEFRNGVIAIRGAGRLNRTNAYLEGLFYVQDTTAALTAEMLSSEPGWTVLDLCSAPGGKAAALAMRMRDEGVILASDIDAERLERVGENAERLGLRCIEIVPAGQVEEAVGKQERLDAIVLDVPCSNTGVLARRVEARWRWSQREMEQLVQTQRELLQKAADLARAGTRILYSTCSIQPEENERQVEWFLEKHRNFKLEKQQLTFPAIETEEQFDHDGGFAAVLLATN